MNVNPTQSTIVLNLSGVSYDLIFDLEAIAQAERIVGLPLLTGLRQETVITPTIDLMRGMLFACLHALQPKLTFDEVKAFVTRENFAQLWNKVLQAWAEGLPEPEDEKAAVDPPQGQS